MLTANYRYILFLKVNTAENPLYHTILIEMSVNTSSGVNLVKRKNKNVEELCEASKQETGIVLNLNTLIVIYNLAIYSKFQKKTY